jgi:hypothetical protein
MQQLTYIRKNTLEWWDVPAPALATPEAAWHEAASAFLERTTKVVVQRAPLSGTTP